MTKTNVIISILSPAMGVMLAIFSGNDVVDSVTKSEMAIWFILIALSLFIGYKLR